MPSVAKPISKQQTSIHAMHTFDELEKPFLKKPQRCRYFAIAMQRQACHSTAAWILPRAQGLEAPAQTVVLVGHEGDSHRDPFLWSSREEEPGEKAQSAWLVGRCVDSDEHLRFTPLFKLNILHVADKWQPDQSPEGCGFGGPTHRWGSSPTVSYLYTSVTGANKQMQTKTTNETEDPFHTSQVITVFFPTPPNRY